MESLTHCPGDHSNCCSSIYIPKQNVALLISDPSLYFVSTSQLISLSNIMTTCCSPPPVPGVQFVNGVSTAMSAGAAAYPGSVETKQIVGDVQQQKSLQQVQITQQQQHQLLQQSSNSGAVQLVDGTTLVPTESLISLQQQPQTLHPLQSATHHPQMATIVTAAGATPILVQPVGPIAVAIGPRGAPTLVNNTGQVIDYSQMNGGGGSTVPAELSAGGAESGGAVAAAAVVPGEYYIQAAGPDAVMHSVVSPEQMMGGGASVAGGGVVASTSDGTPIPFDQLKQLLQTQLEYYFSR